MTRKKKEKLKGITTHDPIKRNILIRERIKKKLDEVPECPEDQQFFKKQLKQK